MKKAVERISAVLLLFCLLLLPSCVGEKRVAVSIGKTDFSVGYCRYLIENFKSAGGENDYPENLRETVLSTLRDAASVYLLAERFGFRKSDYTAIGQERYDEMLASEFKGDEGALKAALAEKHLTKDLFAEMYALTVIEEDVYFYFTSEENGLFRASDEIVTEDIAKNFFHASQILILFEGRTREEAHAIAKEALSKAASGEDFGKLVAEYGEDPGLKEEPDGYYFTHGEFEIPIFEETVRDLEIGETSGIVESGIGLHIIRRLPIEDDYVQSHFDKLRDSFITRLYYEYKEEAASSLDVSVKGAFEELFGN